MIALDLGLTTTGFAWDTGSTRIISPAAVRRSPITPERSQQRLAWWRNTFRKLLTEHDGEHVYVEAPFMSRTHPTGAMSLIELHGVLRLACYDAGVPCVSVPNGQIKKWATGRGNATKPEMVVEAKQRGRNVIDDNEADAFLLHCMVTDRLRAGSQEAT